MSLIEVNLGEDIKELECAPEGEYNLVVESAEIVDKEYDVDGEKVGGHMIKVRIDIESDVAYKPIFHYITLPHALDDADKVEFKSLMLKRFLSAAGVPFDASGFQTEDLFGAQFSCALSVEVDEDGKYDPSNRLMLPRLS